MNHRPPAAVLRHLVAATLLTTFLAGFCQAATLFDHSLSLFQSRAEKASPRDYSFAVLGDSRGNEKVFRKALAVAASFDPLFIVHGGDYSDRGDATETERFLTVLKETVPQLPVFVVQGNHENRGIFAQKVGPSHFTLESERLGLTFLAVDNSEYVLTPAEKEYLARGVAAARRAAFVMMHIPPKTERWSWHTFTEGAEELKKIAASGKLQAFFFSHVHLFDSQRFDGVPAYITGGGGAPLVRFGFPGEAVYHILLVEVKEGKAAVRMVKVR